jgi:hypothetical protein
MFVRTGLHYCAGTKGLGLYVIRVAHLFNVIVYDDDYDDKQMTNFV